ncbi:LOW QUALITY PROTEIN: hypothetical protein Cgig2_030671 [Carnegiea gigantea]|uniref:Endonuclease/exonuclease/phosphatase domain-containing protein n=1 Tax=Carnegiea gigantea TaxID=171969 RepID=A0A9Q1GIM6_9CARY|nr:LOW QUALITY PROTEIN: hypothetical protein Cgig2_030671 [Carnegiea gigantea]
MTIAWCIIGDFNSMLIKDDKQGGNEISDHEVEELSNLMDTCELHEMKWLGIDRAFINAYWYDILDFTHTKYLANGLSDHTPLVIQFTTFTKPKAKFEYYDMWNASLWKHTPNTTAMEDVGLTQAKAQETKQRPLCRPQNPTRQGKNRAQQDKDRTVKRPQQCTYTAAREGSKREYIDILSSSISLIQQQAKINWITQGDENTRLFLAKAKKLTTYIYTIRDVQGNQIEGFDQQGHVLTEEHQVQMCKQFIDKDIKEALLSIPNIKSLGPDGYNSALFKSTWHKVGPICSAI